MNRTNGFVARVVWVVTNGLKRLIKSLTMQHAHTTGKGLMSSQVTPRMQREVNALYRLLYDAVHDLDRSLDLAATSTRESFEYQWDRLQEGRFLLSDPWFKENVARIIAEEEIQIRPEWFKGKRVLDAGCGNGRWSYGFAQLGAHITAVDVNEVAVEQTQRALADFPVEKRFVVGNLETLGNSLGDEEFDLVFCWGVLHHAPSFNESLRQLLRYVKPQGVFYTYLYGRESMSIDADIELFKERVYYNTLPTEAQKMEFLRDKAHGDPTQVHNQHDIYAPLINRRLEYPYVEHFIRSAGFEDVVRTINHTELFVRAIKGNASEYKANWLLPKCLPPYWFQRT